MAPGAWKVGYPQLGSSLQVVPLVQRQTAGLTIGISGFDSTTQAANDYVPRQQPGDISLTHLGAGAAEPLKGDDNRHAKTIVLPHQLS